jgi:hypothetical protein
VVHKLKDKTQQKKSECVVNEWVERRHCGGAALNKCGLDLCLAGGRWFAKSKSSTTHVT